MSTATRLVRSGIRNIQYLNCVSGTLKQDVKPVIYPDFNVGGSVDKLNPLAIVVIISEFFYKKYLKVA